MRLYDFTLGAEPSIEKDLVTLFGEATAELVRVQVASSAILSCDFSSLIMKIIASGF